MSENLKIMCVYAHPDDEIFCAGGTVAKYAHAGAEVMIVAATPGDAGEIRDASAATRRTLRDVRHAEFNAACEKLGAAHIVCWDYGDGTLHQVDMRELTGVVVQAIRSFRPHVVISFGPDGGYGHPDHVAISQATTDACHFSGDPEQYPAQLAEGLTVFQPERLYHAYFPEKHLLLYEYLVQWLVSRETRFHGTLEFVNAMMLLAEEATMLHYARDHVEVRWFPAGFYLVEQGEPPSKLFLILSGEAEVVYEDENGERHHKAVVGVGSFFGEEGLARRKPRNAHVIALTSVTCLVFSAGEPTKFAGRGEGAQFTGVARDDPIILGDTVFFDAGKATVCVDVREFVRQKIEALAQHRTQFPIQPDMFPLSMLEDLFGREYFVRVIPPPQLEDVLL